MLVLALFMVWKRAQFDLTQKENELNHFKNENTVLKKEIAQIKRNNNRFQQQAREEILKLTTENKEVEKEINKLRQTNNNIQRQARFDLKQKRDQLAKLKTESKQNNDRLREQARMEHNQIELELFKLKLENDRLRKEECDLKQRNHRTQEHSRFHLNKTQNELFKVQFEYTEVKKEADELKQALLKQEKEELLPLKIENEKLKKEIHSRRRNHRENSREPVEHECTAWMNTHWIGYANCLIFGALWPNLLKKLLEFETWICSGFKTEFGIQSFWDYLLFLIFDEYIQPCFN